MGKRFREDKEMERKVLTSTDFTTVWGGGNKYTSKERHSQDQGPSTSPPPPPHLSLPTHCLPSFLQTQAKGFSLICHPSKSRRHRAQSEAVWRRLGSLSVALGRGGSASVG